MAALDPDATPEYEDDADSSKPARSTLKVVRIPEELDMDDEDDEDYEDDDEEYSEDDSDDEEVNGGPSDKAKAKKRKEAAALKDIEDAMEEDESSGSDEPADIKSVISQLLKGKAPATGDDEDEDDDEEGLELDETVVCTLDTDKVGFFIYFIVILCNRETELISIIALPTTS
jgi:FK506-binding nuclear protein